MGQLYPTRRGIGLVVLHYSGVSMRAFEGFSSIISLFYRLQLVRVLWLINSSTNLHFLPSLLGSCLNFPSGKTKGNFYYKKFLCSSNFPKKGTNYYVWNRRLRIFFFFFLWKRLRNYCRILKHLEKIHIFLKWVDYVINLGHVWDNFFFFFLLLNSKRREIEVMTF